MNRRFVIAMAALAAGIGTAGIAGPARAIVDPNDLVGSWAGFSQSMRLPAVQDSFFDVFSVRNRRFQGTLEIVPCIFPIEGTLSAANVLDATGLDQHGHHVELHGKVRAMGDGSVRVLATRYHIHFRRGGTMDEGHMLFLQRMGGMDWMHLEVPAVQGNYMGDTMSSMFRNRTGGPAMGMATLMVGEEDQMGSGFCAHGSFLLPYIEQDIRMLDYQGTVGRAMRDGGGSHIGIIGADSNGIIAILIGLLLPAVQGNPTMIQGGYMLYDSFFDVFTELSTDRSMHFDMGTFRLPAVQ